MRRPLASAIGAAAKVWTAAEVVKMSWDLQRCPMTGLAWSSGCMIVLWGAPGSGKSCGSLQIANQVSPVCIASLEESIGPPLSRRLVLAGMSSRSDVTILTAPSIEDLLVAAKLGACIVIDSCTASSFTAQDLRGLCDAGAKLVIVVLHCTKNGTYKGNTSLVHECDIEIEVQRGEWVTRKNRYGESDLQGIFRGFTPTNEELSP